MSAAGAGAGDFGEATAKWSLADESALDELRRGAEELRRAARRLPSFEEVVSGGSTLSSAVGTGAVSPRAAQRPSAALGAPLPLPRPFTERIVLPAAAQAVPGPSSAPSSALSPAPLAPVRPYPSTTAELLLDELGLFGFLDEEPASARARSVTPGPPNGARAPLGERIAEGARQLLMGALVAAGALLIGAGLLLGLFAATPGTADPFGATVDAVANAASAVGAAVRDAFARLTGLFG